MIIKRRVKLPRRRVVVGAAGMSVVGVALASFLSSTSPPVVVVALSTTPATPGHGEKVTAKYVVTGAGTLKVKYLVPTADGLTFESTANPAEFTAVVA